VRVLNGPDAALALFGPDADAAAPALARQKRRQQRPSKAAAAAVAAEANTKTARAAEAAAAAAQAAEDPRAWLRREMAEAAARRAALLAETLAPDGVPGADEASAVAAAAVARAAAGAVRPYRGPSRASRAAAMADDAAAHLALLARAPPRPLHCAPTAGTPAAAAAASVAALSRGEAEAAVAHAVRTLGLGSYSSSSDDGHGGFKGDPGVVSVELDVERLQSGLGVLADLCPNLKSLSLNVNQVGCESSTQNQTSNRKTPEPQATIWSAYWATVA
jgi:hypothetical protein